MPQPPHNAPQQPPRQGLSYSYPGNVQLSPPGPPPAGPAPRQPLSRNQRVGLSGCGILVGGFVVLMTAAMIFGPETVTQVKEKPVPGPTVTVAGPTTTVTASPQLPPPGMPQLTGGTWKDALARTMKLEARSAYSDVQLPADYTTWKVCAQEGTPVDGAAATVILHLAETTCPAKLGDRLTPEPSPAPPAGSDDKLPSTSNGSRAGRTTTGGSTSTGSSPNSGSDSAAGGASTGGDSTSGGSSSSHVVHAGSFCSPSGATGITSAGTPMVCGPGSDGRNRWKRG
ncbi:hypothetical protein [Streptomyces sp. NPDC096033]|uniref:hypothetical protein n=1 Tax=Streptomyces sp. NPDC096033 TaxID=3366071 RepID=UPI00380D70A3